MSSQLMSAATASTVDRSGVSRKIEPLDRERFEQLTDTEAESLLASRFRSFSERGWDWKDALMLAVRPDAVTGRPALPRSGDVSPA